MLRSGLIAKKIGNSSYFSEKGEATNVTILKIDECIVSGIKTTKLNIEPFDLKLIANL